MDKVELGSAAMIFTGGEVRAAAGAEQAVRYLSAQDIDRVVGDLAGLPLSADTDLESFRILVGDVVGRATAGWSWAVVPTGYDDVVADDSVVVVRLRGDPVFPPEFLAAFLRARDRAEVDSADGSGDPPGRIDLERLRGLRIPVPTLSRDHVTQLLRDVDEGIQRASQVSAELQSLVGSALSLGSTQELATELRRTHDLASLVTESLKRNHEPLQQVMELFPYPVARSARRFSQARTNEEQYAALLRTAECLVVSLGVMALAWCRTDSAGEPVLQPWVQRLRGGAITLGNWLAAARDVAAVARPGNGPIQLLGAALRPRGGGLLANLERLVQARNDWAHGGLLTNAEASDRVRELRPVLLNALARSSFMVRSTWILTETAPWRPLTANYEVSALNAMGDHPDFERIDFVSSQPLAERRLYILSADGTPLALAPFAVPLDCPVCRDREIFYVGRQRGRSTSLTSFDRGHETRDADVGAEMIRLFETFAEAALIESGPPDEVSECE